MGAVTISCQIVYVDPRHEPKIVPGLRLARCWEDNDLLSGIISAFHLPDSEVAKITRVLITKEGVSIERPLP